MSGPRPPRVAVIGGGIAGLAAAYFLGRKSGSEVLLLEASDRLGGHIRTVMRDGFVLEEGPDCFLSEKPSGVRISEDLGLGGEMIGTTAEFRRSFILRGSRLVPVPEGLYLMAPSRIWPFLRSPLVSWRGKLRMGMDLIIPRRTEGSDETLGAFVRRRLGREALERIAEPMIGGIYTADPEQLSLRASMPLFAEMERKYGSITRALIRRGREARRRGREGSYASGPRYALFVSYRKGMETLARALEENLHGVSVETNASVKRLKRCTGGSWQVITQSDRVIEVDAAVVAVPAYVASGLIREEDPTLGSLLGGIPYGSSATINLAYRKKDIAHPLDGMGFVVPAREGRPIIGCSFSSRKFEHRAPLGLVLLRAFVGGQRHESVLSLPDDELIELVRRELTGILRISGEPLLEHLARWPKSMPQYVLGHTDRVAEMEARAAKMSGLFLVGSAFTGVGIPDVIMKAEAAALAAIDLVSAKGVPKALGTQGETRRRNANAG